MNTTVKKLLAGAIAVLVTANIFLFNFWLLGFDRLRPNPAKAASTATYTETWKATQLAMTSISDYSGGWYTYMNAHYYLTSTLAPGWTSGRSRGNNMYWWWNWWWWWWWWWWGWWWNNNDNTTASLDPHAFVTKWSVSGTLTQQ